MGTLLEAKLMIKSDREMRKYLVRGERHEILFDLDGDGQADLAIKDINGDGNIDRIAFDLRGDGEFDFFLDDTDTNGVIDSIGLLDENSDHVEILATGNEVEKEVMQTVQDFYTLMQASVIVADELEKELKEVEKSIHKARRELRKV